MYRGIEPIIMVVYRADIMKIIWINWLCLETKDGINGGMMGDIGEVLEIYNGEIIHVWKPPYVWNPGPQGGTLPVRSWQNLESPK